MVKNIAYFRAIQNATNCNTSKEMQTAYQIRRLERDFENPLDVDTFIDYKTGESVRLEIHNKQHSETLGYKESFKSLIDFPVKHGDTFYNPKENSYWLCMEAEQKDYLYYSGTLIRCNWMLKWQNEKGEIIERPSFVQSASQYNSGEDRNNYLILGSNQVMVYLILDDESVKLKSDKRMFIDNNFEYPKPYRLTRADTVTKSYMGVGRMSIIFTECQYNPDTDNIPLMLCDYISPDLNDIKISFAGKSNLRIGGNYKTFTAINENAVSWTISGESSDYVDLIIVDDKTCKIKCQNNDSLIDKNITLTCSSGTQTGTVILTITGGV